MPWLSADSNAGLVAEMQDSDASTRQRHEVSLTSQRAPSVYKGLDLECCTEIHVVRK